MKESDMSSPGFKKEEEFLLVLRGRGSIISG